MTVAGERDDRAGNGAPDGGDTGKIVTDGAGDANDAEVQATRRKLETLETALKEKDKRIAELESDVKWARADFENYRKGVEKRADADRENMRARILKDFLPFLDTFDKAMAVKRDLGLLDSPEPVKKFLGGLESLYKNLNTILDSQKLQRMESLGKRFDYNLHEVAMQVEDATRDEDTIVHEVQQGWLLGGKVLRPAMVGVTKKPAPPPAACEESKDAGNEGPGPEEAPGNDAGA